MGIRINSGNRGYRKFKIKRGVRPQKITISNDWTFTKTKLCKVKITAEGGKLLPPEDRN